MQRAASGPQLTAGSETPRRAVASRSVPGIEIPISVDEASGSSFSSLLSSCFGRDPDEGPQSAVHERGGVKKSAKVPPVAAMHEGGAVEGPDVPVSARGSAKKTMPVSAPGASEAADTSTMMFSIASNVSTGGGAAARAEQKAQEWAAKRKTQIEAAQAKRESDRLGEVTEEHTFRPTTKRQQQKQQQPQESMAKRPSTRSKSSMRSGTLDLPQEQPPQGVVEEVLPCEEPQMLSAASACRDHAGAASSSHTLESIVLLDDRSTSELMPMGSFSEHDGSASVPHESLRRRPLHGVSSSQGSEPEEVVITSHDLATNFDMAMSSVPQCSSMLRGVDSDASPPKFDGGLLGFFWSDIAGDEERRERSFSSATPGPAVRFSREASRPSHPAEVQVRVKAEERGQEEHDEVQAAHREEQEEERLDLGGAGGAPVPASAAGSTAAAVVVLSLLPSAAAMLSPRETLHRPPEVVQNYVEADLVTQQRAAPSLASMGLGAWRPVQPSAEPDAEPENPPSRGASQQTAEFPSGGFREKAAKRAAARSREETAETPAPVRSKYDAGLLKEVQNLGSRITSAHAADADEVMARSATLDAILDRCLAVEQKYEPSPSLIPDEVKDATRIPPPRVQERRLTKGAVRLSGCQQQGKSKCAAPCATAAVEEGNPAGAYTELFEVLHGLQEQSAAKGCNSQMKDWSDIIALEQKLAQTSRNAPALAQNALAASVRASASASAAAEAAHAAGTAAAVAAAAQAPSPSPRPRLGAQSARRTISPGCHAAPRAQHPESQVTGFLPPPRVLAIRGFSQSSAATVAAVSAETTGPLSPPGWQSSASVETAGFLPSPRLAPMLR